MQSLTQLVHLFLELALYNGNIKNLSITDNEELQFDKGDG